MAVNYGMQIFDSNEDLLVQYNDRLGRIHFHGIVSPDASGIIVVPGIYELGTPTIVAFAMIVHTDDDWGNFDGGLETSHAVSTRRVGDNLLVEYQPNPFKSSSFWCTDTQDYSQIFVIGY